MRFGGFAGEALPVEQDGFDGQVLDPHVVGKAIAVDVDEHVTLVVLGPAKVAGEPKSTKESIEAKLAMPLACLCVPGPAFPR